MRLLTILDHRFGGSYVGLRLGRPVSRGLQLTSLQTGNATAQARPPLASAWGAD